MSEDWKNERAEAAMREGTEAIRKAAEERAKEEESKSMIGSFTISVLSKGENRYSVMTEFLKELNELKKRYCGDHVVANIEIEIEPKDCE